MVDKFLLGIVFENTGWAVEIHKVIDGLDTPWVQIFNVFINILVKGFIFLDTNFKFGVKSVW